MGRNSMGEARGRSGRCAALALAAGLTASLFGGPGWGADNAAPANPKLQALIDGARKEGQITLVWAEDTFGGSAAIPRWQDGFNKAYGLDIQFHYTPGLTIPEIENTIAQESAAGRPATSDVLLGTEAEIAAGIAAHLLTPVDWAAWAANVRDPAMLSDPSGMAVEAADTIPAILYNSDKVRGADIPHSLADLLKPQYKGRIASTPYAAYFDFIGNKGMWGEERMVDYLKKFAGQTAGLIRNAEVGRIASGEFDIFALTSNYYAPLWQARGAPIAAAIPTDAAMLDYKYLAVPKNAAHPDAAMLFINYVTSPAGQAILYDTSGSDLHLVQGSRSAKLIRDVEGKGIQFTDVNVAWVERNSAAYELHLRAEFAKILAQK